MNDQGSEERSRAMMIIGCDFHTRYQQIAMMDQATGELTEQRLEHESGEAQAFYRSLPKPVRVGIEATGPIQWFQSLLAELGHELWIGDSAQIRASAVRQQKTDQRDAALILDLLLTNRFPRIWVPSPAERDIRQLLWHRHKLVRMRTMIGGWQALSFLNYLFAIDLWPVRTVPHHQFTHRVHRHYRVADPSGLEGSGVFSAPTLLKIAGKRLTYRNAIIRNGNPMSAGAHLNER
jgi:hypothetical protein